MTRSVRDAVVLHEVLAGRRVALAGRPLAQRRFAVVRTQLLDGLDLHVARAFEAALRVLRDAGARIEEIDLPCIGDLAGLQASGGFTAAESYAWHRELLAARGDGYDPRVRTRIARGEAIRAWEYLQLHRARAGWIARMGEALAGFDAALSPTVPMVAPPIDEVAPGAGRDEAFFRTNALLLRNPSVVNMLDGCALSLPCHGPDSLPVGLMLWHGALHDDTILDCGLAVEAALAVGRA
jgi:Asp-tRNA(Asn)/Glu-tRNA(Gln) amidotransferase A subunit family amidase